MSILQRIKRGWSVFNERTEEVDIPDFNYGSIVNYNQSPNIVRRVLVSERSLLAAIYNRISLDVSVAEIKHVRLNDQGEYESTIDSDLQTCLSLEANLDQSASAFRQDVVSTLLEQGVLAIVPVDTSASPNKTNGYDIYSLRVGIITGWYPQHVKVDVYNERTGQRQELVLPKRFVAIVESPLYQVINEPNSTYQRLVRKLNLLDVIDEQTSSGKLDIIIQLPYTIKNESRLRQAEQRTNNIEMQLKNSKYGIAYIDGTERITQLNRPAENNMLKQVEYLSKMLHDQLGITQEVLAGTASEEVMNNYQNRTIRPIVRAITEAMDRSFLTKTARTQKQAIRWFIDPFDLIPPSQIGDIADKLTRNEIMSSNEIRSKLGLIPSKDPRADELVNKNMPRMEEESTDEDEVYNDTPRRRKRE